MVILLFGPPGCGKGTQGQMLLQWLEVKIPAISTGEMLRAQSAAEAKEVMAAGGLVSDETINHLLAERIQQKDCDGGFLLDGYPRTPEQAVFLDELLKKRGLPPPVVLHLDVPADVLVGRMLSRRQCGECGLMFNILSKRPRVPGRCDSCGGPLAIRKDDREQVIRQRLRTYEEQTRPVLNHYSNGCYHRIPGDRATPYIFEAITEVLKPLL